MKKTYYIGLDVHKDSIAIAYAPGGSRKSPTYHGECGGSNLAAERALRALAKKLGVKLRDLKVCYEAGPTGFVLARRLRQLGVDCILMSPSKTQRKPNDRIKTDRRDACNRRQALPQRRPQRLSDDIPDRERGWIAIMVNELPSRVNSTAGRGLIIHDLFSA